ncbi:hypothetical protein CBR_g12961 [Chara braunii]|uniref:Uncharacterized protein n=1 Tax=Chara braunii TaxID=69332 RepID=A0A388KTI3_CHABU|nr:hypothetical protein CBR_g12961 [Chara braunii]|eukprot:GBG73243.1 hypothetical protein CBR_g12961 [Chara braunii]
MAWEKLFLIGPMEVNAWTAGSNSPTEMCGVIPEINVRIASQKIKGECVMARRRTFLEERPLGIEPPREVPGGVEVSLPAASEGWHRVADWVGVELAENMVYLATEVEWRADENGEWNPDPRGHVCVEGRLYVSENGWREFGVRLASGEDPLSMFEGAWQLVWRAGFEFADPGVDDVTADLRVAMVGSFELPSENVRMRLPPFLLEKLGGLELVRQAVADLASLTYEEAMVHREYYRAFLEMGPFSGEQKYEVLRILRAVFSTRPRVPVVGSEVLWGVVRREINQGMAYADDLYRLYEQTEEGTSRCRGDPCTRDHPRKTEVDGRCHSQQATRFKILDVEWRAVTLGRGQAFMMVECLWDEGTPKTREKQRESKEGEGASAAGEAGGSVDGLKKVVATLNRTLNKNQGYLADAKKKLTFDGANITEFLIDYENLAALLKWTEEEKMEHLGQHVSLSLGRDIMAIVASSGSWKETRNEMMRKYLKAEKMATEAELAAVQRKNYATYNDFLRAFTLVALRIPGVTDRIMSKYFLRQFSEFEKDKILSAYQQTSKFEYTRDVDFSTVTDLAEKTVVTETLALFKEGEVIDLTGKTGDKAQVSRPALPPQEAVVPAAVANRGFGRRDPANEQYTIMEELAGTSTGQQETEVGGQEKDYGKPREEEPVDKATAAKKKFRYQISILTSPEIDGTLSKLLGTMVSVSFQTMLQASPRLLKGLRQLLTRKRVEVEEAPKLQEQDTEETEAPQGVSNLQSIPEGLKDLEKAFADIRLNLPDREGGEVMRAPPGTKLSFHALPVGKLKIQIGTHHTDALVAGGAEITLIRRDFAIVTGCTVNKEVAGSIRGASGKIPFTGYVTKCAVRAGIRESIWSFQRMTVMEEMDHDVIPGDHGPGKEGAVNSRMEFGNENDNNAINRPTEGQPSRQAGESSSRKRKLYVGFDHNLVVNRGGKKQGTRGPSPPREGEPIVLPSESDTSSEEEGNLEEGQRPGENDPVEFIDLTSDEDEDEVTMPTREERGRGEEPGERKDKWIEEFGPEFSDWFDQWSTILRYQWIMKAREKLGRGEDLSPTAFFSEGTLLQLQAIKRQMEQESKDRTRREAQRRPPGR